ncbi:unnamed protein product, partial [Symbiodinium sp. KB8]
SFSVAESGLASSLLLRQLCEPRRLTPCEPPDPDPELLAFRPEEQCALPLHPFLASLRTATRGSAAGPSGITNEPLRILLDDEADCTLSHRAAGRLARADVPVTPVVAAIRAGRIVALRKPSGRARALVVGDVMRRLVGRTLAQGYASELQTACMPSQHGLSTRAGTEALVRLLCVATGSDPRATMLSIDAIGAFDHVSRHAMLAGLRQRPGLQPLLPYVRQFYASDSTYVWQDPDSQSHEVRQSEGGEQGDPFMPALYAITQHPALTAVHTQLRAGEAVFAYMSLQFPSASGNCWTPVSGHFANMRALGLVSPRSPICTLRGYFCTTAPSPPTSCMCSPHLMPVVPLQSRRQRKPLQGYRVPAWDAPEPRHPAQADDQAKATDISLPVTYGYGPVPSRHALRRSAATRRKRRDTYPELSRSPRCHLVVFPVEIGGRWGSEPASFLRLLARARAARAHAAVRSALRAADVSRWSSIIAVAVQRALASSLLELPFDTVAFAAGEPAVYEALQDERWLHAPASSRPPARA